MDEIIEKLNRKTPDKSTRFVAEPITARVSREKGLRKRLVTPPELYYRSPHLTNKFYAKAPEWIHPPHVCAASLEADAFRLLRPKYENHKVEQAEILYKSTIQELQKVCEYSLGITDQFRCEKVMTFEKCQEIYEAITLFRSPIMLKRLLANFPINYKLHENGHTCLHYASEIGNYEMIDLIVKHGDDVNVKSAAGVAPLHLASANGHVYCIDLLVSKGADIRVKDRQFGWDALHWAVYSNQYQVVVFLVEHLKAVIGEKDFEQRDAAELAKHLGSQSIFVYLISVIRNTASWRL